ncbi:MAG TPA: hypothetical protein VHB98_01975 [Chloroflexota bacterium]|jgi:hypothetical protein|nr:hypothetical protein [Chloroflexota bacterium]
MRQWDVVIEGEGAAVTDAWGQLLTSALLPYIGVVRVEECWVAAQLTVPAPEAHAVADQMLKIWYDMRPRARLTALLVRQVYVMPVPGPAQRRA